jgi:hypothetical protein
MERKMTEPTWFVVGTVFLIGFFVGLYTGFFMGRNQKEKT